MKQFESRFTKYYKAKIYESPEPGLFGARATQIGEVDVEIADGAFESGGERNVFMMRFLRRTELFQTVPDAQGRQQQFKTFEAEARRRGDLEVPGEVGDPPPCDELGRGVGGVGRQGRQARKDLRQQRPRVP